MPAISLWFFRHCVRRRRAISSDQRSGFRVLIESPFRSVLGFRRVHGKSCDFGLCGIDVRGDSVGFGELISLQLSIAETSVPELISSLNLVVVPNRAIDICRSKVLFIYFPHCSNLGLNLILLVFFVSTVCEILLAGLEIWAFVCSGF